jgi:peptidyl-dipeptidase A
MRRYAAGIFIIILSVSSCCTEKEQSEGDGSRFVENFESKLAHLEASCLMQEWKQSLTSQADSLEYYRNLRSAYLLQPALLTKATAYRKATNDEILSRKLELVYRIVLEERLKTDPDVKNLTDSLQKIFRGSRSGTATGDEGVDKHIEKYRFNNNRQIRKEAFLSLENPGRKLSRALVQLIRLRNQTAKSLGYNSYYSLKMFLADLDPSFIDSLYHLLENASTELYQEELKNLRNNLGVDALEIWDLWVSYGNLLDRCDQYLTADSQLYMLKAAFEIIGFDLDKLPIYFDRAHYQESAAARVFPIHCPNDIRISLNLQDGHESMNRLLRESVAALYCAHIDQADYLFKGSPANCWTEAGAAIFENIVQHEECQRRCFHLPDDFINRWQRVSKNFAIIDLRIRLLLGLFEKELYQRPERDLNDLFWRLFERIMLLPAHKDIPVWSTLAEYIDRPFHTQDLIIADLIAAQILAHLQKRNKSVIGNNTLKHFLVQDFFRHGRRYGWRHILKWTTGEELSANHFLRQHDL